MRKVLIVLALSFTASLGFADIRADGELGISSDTGQKSCALSPSTGTVILTNEPYTNRTYLVNRSSWTTFYVSTGTSAGITPTTGFPIPPNTSFSPDGPVVPWWGSLFCVVSGTGTPSAQIDTNIGIFKAR